MKTLLVHDGSNEPDLRRSLTERGCEVLSCGGASDAKALFGLHRPSLVVIDLLNSTEGEELGRWLRNRSIRLRSYVLLAILPEQVQEGPRLLEVAADDLVLRPFDSAALQLRIDCLRRQSRRGRDWQDKEDALNIRAQQQVAIAALGQAAFSEDLPTLFDLAGRLIIYTVEVPYFCVLDRADEGEHLTFVAGFGWKESYVGRSLPKPVPGSVTARTCLGEDLFGDALDQEKQFEGADFLADHEVVSGLSVAIKGKARGVFGLLGAYTTEKRNFTEDDLRFLEGLANVLGAAMERQHASAELQKYQSQVQHLQRLESVGQLAAGLAHDYNNVLTIIHGHVTLALGDPRLSPKVAASMKTVLDATESAAGLTRQMLSFSRKQSIKTAHVDLNVVIEKVVKLLDRALGRTIRLETQLAVLLPAVDADAGMLDQVLMNLAVNARDAMPSGGRLAIGTRVVDIGPSQIRRHPEASPGEFVCLSVADTGCGMDPATIRRIFDPFFTTKEPGKGTGLGLSTVYGLIKQHRGWVEVESQPGEGTTFRIFLPSLGLPLEQSVQPGGRASQATRIHSPETVILLVEDEQALRELARLFLEELGFGVIEAGTGYEALQAWEQNKERIKLVLTDLVLPDGLTGFELAEQLQQSRAELPIIFTSGYDAEKVRTELPRGQAFHFVQKPYRSETLADAIDEALRVVGAAA